MSPKRIQSQRTAGWRMPEGAVYVGRPTKWGNPFKVGVAFCGPTIQTLHTPAEVVAHYRRWLSLDTLHPLMWDKPLIVAHVYAKAGLLAAELAGRDLACWCPLDQPCHADVLLELANQEVHRVA